MPFASIPTPAGPPPSLDEVDRAIATWADRLARVDANLVDLDSQPTYQMLQGGLSLEGATKERVLPVIQAVQELFAQRTLLSDVVDEARTLRGSINRLFPSDKTLRAIDALLNGPSITLPGVRTPLAKRSLLDAATNQTSLAPDDLLRVMTSVFDQARDAVLELDAAWERVRPALEAAERQVQALEARAARLGASAEAEVTGVRADLARLRQQVLADPIGAHERFERGVRRRIEMLAARLDGLQRERDVAQAELDRAQARQARMERKAAELDPGQVAGLGAWLDRIAETAAAGRFRAVRIGLGRWNDAAAPLYRTEEARLEQIDLLRALRAKAQALRSRGLMVDPDLDALAQDAEAALGERPPALEQAAQLLSTYQRGLARIG